MPRVEKEAEGEGRTLLEVSKDVGFISKRNDFVYCMPWKAEISWSLIGHSSFQVLFFSYKMAEHIHIPFFFLSKK